MSKCANLRWGLAVALGGLGCGADGVGVRSVGSGDASDDADGVGVRSVGSGDASDDACVSVSKPANSSKTLATGLVLALGSASCDDVPPAENFFNGECAADEPATFILEASREFYLYPDQLPDLAPVGNDARAYLARLIQDVDLAPENPDRFVNDRFSFTSSIQRFTESSTGNFVGLGFQYRIAGEVGDRFLRLFDVLGSGPLENPAPAGDAGLQRADKIVAINGQTVEAILTDRPDDENETLAIRNALGTGEEGEQVTLEVERPDESRFSATLTRRAIQQTEVPYAEVFDLEGGGRAGYMAYRSFTESSTRDLTEAVATFADANITQLIVDLRYNGGGLILVSHFFANLLMGQTLSGTTFARTIFNPQQSSRSSLRRFAPPACPPDFDCGDAAIQPLSGLTDIVFITTGSTASASELLINGLQPHVNISIVGSTTFGKPVGSLPLEHTDCDTVYSPVTLKIVNSEGNGDYFGGFPVTCAAADDATHRFADPEEESLAAALELLNSGVCPDSALMSLRASPASRRLTYGQLIDSLEWH